MYSSKPSSLLKPICRRLAAISVATVIISIQATGCGSSSVNPEEDNVRPAQGSETDMSKPIEQEPAPEPSKDNTEPSKDNTEPSTDEAEPAPDHTANEPEAIPEPPTNDDQEQEPEPLETAEEDTTGSVVVIGASATNTAPATPSDEPEALVAASATSIDSNLDREKKSWYFNRNKTNTPPTAQNSIDIGKFGGYYLGDVELKNIYLTFDEGYENGYSSKILDVLKEKDVKAAFFVTKQYIDKEPELIKRMLNEGHLVCNHSATHPSMPDKRDEDVLKELNLTAQAYTEVTGAEMPKYFRPPMGEYSEHTLMLTQNAGYKTIFWSYAYRDWLVDEQPGKDVALKTALDNHHNGMIMLLHAVSQSNTEALPEIIDSYRSLGYKFVTLDDLP